MNQHIISYLTCLVLVFVLASCEPQIDDKTSLPAAPTSAEFTIEPTGEDNTFRFVSTASDAFLFGWDLGNGVTTSGSEAIGFYMEAGVYVVELTVFNSGGHVTSTQSVIVENDIVIEQGPCDEGSLTEFLSNCDSKTWRLIPAEGALLVGPQGLSETWWMNGQMDVDDRPCQFDDEWTFTEDGAMVYDTKGDIWGEDYLGFNFECVADDQLGSDVAAWGAGSHSYTTIDNTLTVSGLGAFIGLPKAANGGEVGFPVSEVSYTVTQRTTDAATGNDLMVIQVDFGDGIWQFTLVAI